MGVAGASSRDRVAFGAGIAVRAGEVQRHIPLGAKHPAVVWNRGNMEQIASAQRYNPAVIERHGR